MRRRRLRAGWKRRGKGGPSRNRATVVRRDGLNAVKPRRKAPGSISVIALSCGRAGPHRPGTLAASSERLSVSAGPRPPGCRRSLLRGGARSGQQPQMRETLAGSQEPAARPRSRSAVERKRRLAVPMEEFVRPLPWAREPLQVAPSSEERVEIRPALRPLLPRWQVVKPELMAQRELSTRPAAAHTRLLTLPVRVANLERRHAEG